jgi:hypothetical protein
LLFGLARERCGTTRVMAGPRSMCSFVVLFASERGVGSTVQGLGFLDELCATSLTVVQSQAT